MLEGGYDLEGLRRSVAAVLREMSGDRLQEPVSPAPGPKPDLRESVEIAKYYWQKVGRRLAPPAPTDRVHHW